MTIAILKLEPGQTIARPFSRAIDWSELVEILDGFQLNTEGGLDLTAPGYFEKNLDTEKPIFQITRRQGFTKFFAFTE